MDKRLNYLDFGTDFESIGEMVKDLKGQYLRFFKINGKIIALTDRDEFISAVIGDNEEETTKDEFFESFGRGEEVEVHHITFTRTKDFYPFRDKFCRYRLAK